MKQVWITSMFFFVSAPAWGVITTGFESGQYTGSAAGTVLSGQNGWSQPVAGDTDFRVYTYAGNTLGIPTNPFGGQQFIGGESLAGAVRARAQIDQMYSPSGQYRFTYDVCAGYRGPMEALGTHPKNGVAGLGAMPDSSERVFWALAKYGNEERTTWSAQYTVWDAAGNLMSGVSPGGPWDQLAGFSWFRQSTVIDFTTNRIVSVAILDMTTGSTSMTSPVGWYLCGGATPLNAMPYLFAVFAHGNEGGGNVMAYDNLTIEQVPTPGSVALLGAGAVLAWRRFGWRRRT